MSTQRATNEALKAWMASRPEEEQQVVALKMFVSAHASQARFDVEECGSMYKYEIILYWSNADSAFVAELSWLKFQNFPDVWLMETLRMPLSGTSLKRWNSGLIQRESSAIQYRNPRASVCCWRNGASVVPIPVSSL